VRGHKSAMKARNENRMGKFLHEPNGSGLR
jgi:hypothetical protein